MGKALPVFYDCHNCPAYCCTYPRIEVTARDIERFARHFGVDAATAKKRFTRKGPEPGETILRHQLDEVFGSACWFLDRETRLCTVHEARPDICRAHPGTPTCGYYVFLMGERGYQKNPKFIARAYNPQG